MGGWERVLQEPALLTRVVSLPVLPMAPQDRSPTLEYSEWQAFSSHSLSQDFACLRGGYLVLDTQETSSWPNQGCVVLVK